MITSDRKSRLTGLIAQAKKDFAEHGVLDVYNQAGNSGGKDSTAMYLLAYELEIPITPVYCDTDNEHTLTSEYIKTFNKTLLNAPEIVTLKKVYTEERFKKRREAIAKKWRMEHSMRQGKRKGEIIPIMSEKQIEDALSVLHPTGNSFLDMCLLHGMFPLRRSQFCTDELKTGLVYDEILKPQLDLGDIVYSWSGVRKDESKKRSAYEIISQDNRHENLKLFAPLLEWTAEDVFEMHKRHNIEPNPLYKMGMGRVGCMPCINCGKNEIREIDKRFPEYFDKIEGWEELVSKVGRFMLNEGRTAAFLGVNTSGNKSLQGGVKLAVEWSKTTRGGKNLDWVRAADDDVEACSSIYGLCE